MGEPEEPSKSLSPEAIAQLVGGHRQFLGFLEKRVESRAAAEDILQSAFARGLEHGASPQDEKAVAWFYRILRNAVIDHYRPRASCARAAEAWGGEFVTTEKPAAAAGRQICRRTAG